MMHPSAVSARLVINGLSHSLERDWRILAAGLCAPCTTCAANAARASWEAERRQLLADVDAALEDLAKRRGF